MKRTATITITILVGIIIGLLMRDTSSAQRPPNAGPPAGTQPLTTVAHDATLIGDGTATSPLGVAPSAGMNLVDHHQHLEAIVASTDSFTFTLPKANVPVNVILSVSGVEVNGQACGPTFMEGIFMLDSSTGKTTGSFATVIAAPGASPSSVPPYAIDYTSGPNRELGSLSIRANSIPGQPAGTITSAQATWRVIMLY